MSWETSARRMAGRGMESLSESAQEPRYCGFGGQRSSKRLRFQGIYYVFNVSLNFRSLFLTVLHPSEQIWLYRGTVVPRYRCTEVPMYRCTDVPRYRCTEVPMYRGTEVPMYRGNFVPGLFGRVTSFYLSLLFVIVIKFIYHCYLSLLLNLSFTIVYVILAL